MTKKGIWIVFVLIVAILLSACSKEDKYYLNVSPSAISVFAEGGTEEITVSSNGYWTYQWNDKSPDWIGVAQTDRGLRITVNKNTANTHRTATLLVFKNVESLQETFKSVGIEQWGAGQ